MNAKLTVADIQATIKKESYYRFEGTTVTVCCLTLTNGYNVTGESACVDPDEFNEATGKQYAKESAVGKIWNLEGYMLKQRLFCFQK